MVSSPLRPGHDLSGQATTSQDSPLSLKMTKCPAVKQPTKYYLQDNPMLGAGPPLDHNEDER